MQVGSFADAASFGDVVILAVQGTAAIAAVPLVGTSVMAGKVVIDATNPIADKPPVNGVLQFFTGPNESLLEIPQCKCLDIHFALAFVRRLLSRRGRFVWTVKTRSSRHRRRHAKQSEASSSSTYSTELREKDRGASPAHRISCI